MRSQLGWHEQFKFFIQFIIKIWINLLNFKVTMHSWILVVSLDDLCNFKSMLLQNRGWGVTCFLWWLLFYENFIPKACHVLGSAFVPFSALHLCCLGSLTFHVYLLLSQEEHEFRFINLQLAAYLGHQQRPGGSLRAVSNVWPFKHRVAPIHKNRQADADKFMIH